MTQTPYLDLAPSTAFWPYPNSLWVMAYFTLVLYFEPTLVSLQLTQVSEKDYVSGHRRNTTEKKNWTVIKIQSVTILMLTDRNFSVLPYLYFNPKNTWGMSARAGGVSSSDFPVLTWPVMCIWIQLLATGRVGSILPPSLPRLFSPHWAVNSGWGQKLYTLYKQSSKAAVHWVILRSVWELRGTLFISFVLVSVNSAVWGKAYCAGQCFLLT